MPPYPKIDKELIEKICGYIRTGITIEQASLAVGIHGASFHRWRRRGLADIEEGKETIHSFFVQEIERTYHEREAYLSGIIMAAAPQDWRAALAILERTRSERWAAKNRTEITGKEGKPIELRAAAPEQPTDLEAYERFKKALDDVQWTPPQLPDSDITDEAIHKIGESE